MSQIPLDMVEDLDHATAVATKAMQRLKADKIAPTPANFGIWYTYYANTNALLNREIDQILQKNKRLDEADCRRLYAEFVDANRDQNRVERAGDRLQSTITEVSELMTGMKTMSHEYSHSLEEVETRLGGIKEPEELRTLLHDAAKDTRGIIEQNSLLEAELDKSVRVMGELRLDMERIKREAMTDGLTGLANRKAFDQRIAQMMAEARDFDTSFTLVLADIDHFKSFNDMYGHQVGDQVLRLVAHTLTDGVKGRDCACRYGGEEFAILLPDTSVEASMHVAETLRKSLEAKEIINRKTGKPLGRITMSMGVAEFRKTEEVDDLIERADKALYQAKRAGRNQVAQG